MAYVNKTILIGNVGQDPIFKDHGNNFVTASFSLATTKSWKDRNSGQRVEHTDWHRIEATGKLAEIVRDIVQEGDQLYVEGELNYDRVESKDEGGKPTFYTKIRADQVQKLGKRDRQATGGSSGDAGEDQVQGHGEGGASDGAGQGGGDAPAASAPAAAAQPAPAAAPAAADAGAPGKTRMRTFGNKKN